MMPVWEGLFAGHSNSGSGNQGIAATMPVVVMAVTALFPMT
nr:hypothetical protein [Xenorhabdus lircayensis]